MSDSTALPGLTAKSFGQQYYEEHKAAGIDYLAYGDWQRDYGRWIVEALELHGKLVLDIGCACGAITRGFTEAGAIAHGVDVNEYAINLGRRHYGLQNADRLHICDGAHLHLFPDETFDLVHSHQVLEHVRPELVQLTLKEMHRVCKTGGLFLAIFDTSESLQQQERDLANEDPTHVSIQSMEWWVNGLFASGWFPLPDRFRRLRRHLHSFLDRYPNWSIYIGLKELQP